MDKNTSLNRKASFTLGKKDVGRIGDAINNIDDADLVRAWVQTDKCTKNKAPSITKRLKC